MQSEAALCCRALGAEQDGFVTYGKFRNFLILLPEAKLREADPSIAWYEAATMVPFGEHLPPALIRLYLSFICSPRSCLEQKASYQVPNV